MSIEQLISDLCQKSFACAAEALRSSLTMGNCVPIETALEALSRRERLIVSHTLKHGAVLSSTLGNMALVFRPHGRLYLIPREQYDQNADRLILLGLIEVDSAMLDEYHILREHEEKALESRRAEICAYFSRYGFRQAADELRHYTEHVAPLIYYVGQHCVSNFYQIGRLGHFGEITLISAFEDMAEQHEQTGIISLTIMYCLHLLLRSGSYTRPEELNSSQLNLDTLAAFFIRKHSLYRQKIVFPDDVCHRFNEKTLSEQAEILASMRANVASSCRFTRHINGINLRKQEIISPLPPSDTDAVLAPITRSAHALATLQRWLPCGMSALLLFKAEKFSHLLDRSLLAREQHAFGSCLEYLIDRVVAEAVRSTNSDFGMTRSTRDFRRFIDALDSGDTVGACDLSQAGYFCHVVPSAAIVESNSAKIVNMTLNAISARMRYNAWHYAPSYFPLNDIPAGRGWFYAPRMADIADYSDQHHAGHVHAVVRFTIRSPLGLSTGTRDLPGFIDLRLMRQSGDSYSEEELLTVIAFTEVLQFLYQHLLNHLLQYSTNFVFSFGDKAWFDKHYAPQALIA